MPRHKQTSEELALKKQVEDLIKNIKGSDKPTVDIDRAVKLFKRAQELTQQAINVLEGFEEEVEPGKKRAGRPRKDSTESPELFDSQASEAAEPAGVPTAGKDKNKTGAKKQAPTAAEIAS